MKKGLEELTRGFVSKPGLEKPEYYGFYEVTCFDCPSFVMFTANDCPRSGNILTEKQFEPESMRLWCRLCRTATSIVDIGAQVGVYSLAAAALRDDIPIHAFEPNPYAFARLRIHKDVNGFANIVEHRCAVASQSGLTRLTWCDRGWISSGGTVLPQPDPQGRRQVVFAEVKTLDDALGDQVLGERPLIKIDVEGAEMSVFKGMRRTLDVTPDILLETFNPDVCTRLNEILLPMGYKVWEIDESAGPRRKDKLTAASIKSGNFNQFLSVREEI